MGGRVDLQRKFFLRVEQFDEQREAAVERVGIAQQFAGVIFHKPTEVLAGKRAIGNDTGVAGPVADFPRFTDGLVGRQLLAVEPRQIAPAPDALLENRTEGEGIQHGRFTRFDGQRKFAAAIVEY